MEVVRVSWDWKDGRERIGVGRVGEGGYFFEEDLDLGFGVFFFFCGFWGDVGGGGEAGVGVEESVCLSCGQYQVMCA